MKKLLILATLTTSLSAHADNGGCIVGPTMSNNKTLHLIGSGLISATVTKYTDNAWYGLGAGLLAGAVREGYKIKSPGMRCEWASIGYDLVGSISGAYLAPSRNGFSIGYIKAF
jgi:hypothetical protein